MKLRALVIDDASPDPAVTRYLDALAAEWDDEGWDPTAPQDVAA